MLSCLPDSGNKWSVSDALKSSSSSSAYASIIGMVHDARQSYYSIVVPGLQLLLIGSNPTIGGGNSNVQLVQLLSSGDRESKAKSSGHGSSNSQGGLDCC